MTDVYRLSKELQVKQSGVTYTYPKGTVVVVLPIKGVLLARNSHTKSPTDALSGSISKPLLKKVQSHSDHLGSARDNKQLVSQIKFLHPLMVKSMNEGRPSMTLIPPPQTAQLVLKVIDELHDTTVKNIAQKAGVPEGQVKAKVKEIEAKLKEKVSPDKDPEKFYSFLTNAVKKAFHVE